MAMFTVFCCLLLLSGGQVLCRPEGPPTEVAGVPTEVCTTLVPTSGSPHNAQSGDGGFSITVDSDLPITSIAPGAFYTFTAGEVYDRK